MEFMSYTQSQQAFHHPAYPHYTQEYPSYIDNQHRAYAVPRRSSSMTNLNQLVGHNGDRNETKPRLSKQEVEILERQFQEQHKPTSNTKRQLAERFHVDVARINNWFQNRRAKAKQEKKQEEYGLRQASRSLPYSEPSSPEHWNSSGYAESKFQSPESSVTPFSLSTRAPPSAAASYSPRYQNPSEASMNSLQRTLYEAESAVERGQFDDDEFQEQEADAQFGAALPFNNNNNNSFPMGDRAQFPMPEAPVLSNFGFPEAIFAAEETMFSIEPASQQQTVMRETLSEGFGCYVTGPEEHQNLVDRSMTTFPSQLLSVGQDSSELTPRPFQPQNFHPVEVDSGSQSPPEPMESRFKSPPPPADIASRRAKRRPAALGTMALKDKSSSGPKTANIPRPLGSPAIAMRRVSSVNGNLNVLAGRIQKSTNHIAQRSPLQRHFSEGGMSFLEQHSQSIQHMPMPMPMLSASWLDKPFAPPTPNSPREMMLLQQQQQQQQHQDMQREENTQHQQEIHEEHANSLSSPPDSEQSYIFNRAVPGCFTSTGLNTNMASPPETPANPGAPLHWAFEVPDDALLTPGFGTFAADGHVQMPQPHYVSSSTSSQPPTPAFGQFNGFPYIHTSPVFELQGDSSDIDYSSQYFPDGSVSSYPTISSSHSSPEAPKNEKTYTFNNATSKDFE